jgi:uncharacterized protein with NRDE domain
MCTALWWTSADGYELFFNRDESAHRGIARPPEPFAVDGVRCLAPVDADAGGTWLGVSEHGVAVGLLNGRDVRPEPAALRSRGLLVRELLSARGIDGVSARLAAQDLARYRAFTLVAFEPGRVPVAHEWSGLALAAAPATLPLSSSSLDAGRARVERTRAFERLVREHGGVDRELLAEFQKSHEPERGPWSPCMHRADASTVSASHVRVTRDSVAFRYAAGAPCTTEFEAPRMLERSYA